MQALGKIEMWDIVDLPKKKETSKLKMDFHN